MSKASNIITYEVIQEMLKLLNEYEKNYINSLDQYLQNQQVTLNVFQKQLYSLPEKLSQQKLCPDNREVKDTTKRSQTLENRHTDTFSKESIDVKVQNQQADKDIIITPSQSNDKSKDNDNSISSDTLYKKHADEHNRLMVHLQYENMKLQEQLNKYLKLEKENEELKEQLQQTESEISTLQTKLAGYQSSKKKVEYKAISQYNEDTLVQLKFDKFIHEYEGSSRQKLKNYKFQFFRMNDQQKKLIVLIPRDQYGKQLFEYTKQFGRNIENLHATFLTELMGPVLKKVVINERYQSEKVALLEVYKDGEIQYIPKHLARAVQIALTFDVKIFITEEALKQSADVW